MYAKLFARITESSLMETEIPVRYTFVMLLAIADPSGLVVGTDIALARRFNMPLPLLRKCVRRLQSPDEQSNSKESEGRRIMPSEGERGYQIINYVKYRNIQDEEERRSYMREYMRVYRGGKPAVNSVNSSKPALAPLAHSDSEAEANSEPPKSPKGDGGISKSDVGKSLHLKRVKEEKLTEANELRNRYSSEVAGGDVIWSDKEARAKYRQLCKEAREVGLQIGSMA